MKPPQQRLKNMASIIIDGGSRTTKRIRQTPLTILPEQRYLICNARSPGRRTALLFQEELHRVIEDRDQGRPCPTSLSARDDFSNRRKLALAFENGS